MVLLILKKGLEIKSKAKIITYSIEDNEADFYAFNIRFEDEKFLFDAKFKGRTWQAIQGTHATVGSAISCRTAKSAGSALKAPRLGSDRCRAFS